MSTILVVEDFKPVRAIITSLIDGNPDFCVISEATDGVEAITIGLPKLNGLEAARRIRELVPSSKIVFLTQETSADVLKEALSL